MKGLMRINSAAKLIAGVLFLGMACPLFAQTYPVEVKVPVTFYDHYDYMSERDCFHENNDPTTEKMRKCYDPAHPGYKGYTEFGLGYWIRHSTPGMVQTNLDGNGMPVPATTGNKICELHTLAEAGTPMCRKNSGFSPQDDMFMKGGANYMAHNRDINKWWTEDLVNANVKKRVYKFDTTLTFTHTPSEGVGMFEFKNTDFYAAGNGKMKPFEQPHNGQARPGSHAAITGGPKNSSWTTHLSASLVYNASQTGIVLEVRGDDDIWVFIDGKLALDGGGIHTFNESEINMESFLGTLGLADGQTYSFDLFHADRNAGGMFSIKTNLPIFKKMSYQVVK